MILKIAQSLIVVLIMWTSYHENNVSHMVFGAAIYLGGELGVLLRKDK